MTLCCKHGTQYGDSCTCCEDELKDILNTGMCQKCERTWPISANSGISTECPICKGQIIPIRKKVH